MKKSVIFLLFTFSCFAQKSFEAGITFDNDLFTSTEHDRYYTNGIEIFCRYLNKPHSAAVNKKITEFKIGQYIYNPQSVKAANYYVNDRPFAGYLFGHYGQNRFFNNESVLKVNGQLGYVGPNAFGQEVQEFIHNTFGYHRVEGWQYQITNAFAAQLGMFYSHKLFPKTFSRAIDFHARGEINAGTIFNGAQVGLLSRISLKKPLQPVYDSNLYGASLNADKSKYREQSELYLYFSPNINYQLYDATIKGSYFNDSSPVTFPLVPFRFNGEAGIKYRKNNLNLSYTFMYRGKELYNRVITGYYYGSITASWLFK